MSQGLGHAETGFQAVHLSGFDHLDVETGRPTCSTHPVQQPQFGSLVTTIFGRVQRQGLRAVGSSWTQQSLQGASVG